jgi:hypothetical protein
MKQPPGDGKRRNTGRRKDNAGGYTGSRGKRKTGPPVGPSTRSYTSITLARHIKCARLPPRKSSGCIWMRAVMSTVGRGVVQSGQE